MEFKNYVGIEGILSEVKLERKVYNSHTTGQPTECIRGTIKVLVDPEKNVEVPIAAFANKYTIAGEPNPSYVSLEGVLDMVSIAACGSLEDADRVRVGGAQLEENRFINRMNKPISFPRISARFVDVVRRDEFEPRAIFEVDALIGAIAPVLDADGIEVSPAELEVTASILKYGGAVDVIRFKAKDPNIISAIKTFWNPDTIQHIVGDIDFMSKTVEVEKSVGFGQPTKQKRTTFVSDLTITAGSGEPVMSLDDEGIKLISEGLAKRKAELSGEAKKPAAPVAPSNSSQFGF